MSAKQLNKYRTQALKKARKFIVTAQLTKPSQNIVVLIASVRLISPGHMES